MKSTSKIIQSTFIILLFLSSTIIPTIAAETKLIIDKKSDLAKKHIIYIIGNGLKEIKYNENCYKGPLSFFYHFFGFNGSYVRLSFENSGNVLMIKDGIPRIIQSPVNLEFGLSDPNTFTLLMWSRQGKALVFSYCLYIIIDQNIVI